jgi:hypothetical protein
LLSGLAARARLFGLLRFARNVKMTSSGATNWHDGQITKSMSISSRKNIPLAPSGKSMTESARLTRYEGRVAIVTNARWDAVDAECARRTRMKRTAKSCGPDAAVLASSCLGFTPWVATVAKEPFTGEITL